MILVNQKRELYLYFLAMLTAGMVLVAHGPCVDTLIDTFDSDKVGIGFLASAYSLGTFPGVFLADWVIRRYGASKGLTGITLLRSLVLLVFSLNSSLPVAYVLYGLVGATNGLLFAGLTAQTTRRTAPHQSRYLSWLYSAFGLGVVLGPLMIGSLLAHGYSWRLAYRLLALCTTTGVLLLLGSEAPAPQEDTPNGKPLRPLPAAFYFWCLALTSYVATEGALSTWSSKYILDVFEHGIGYQIVTIFWVFMFLGRLLAGWLLPFFSEQSFVSFACGVAFVCTMIASQASSLLWVLIAFAGTALALAGIYPGIMSLISKQFASFGDRATNMATALGNVGVIGFTPLVGAIADMKTLRGAIFASALPLLIVIVVIAAFTMNKSKGIGARRSKCNLS